MPSGCQEVFKYCLPLPSISRSSKFWIARRTMENFYQIDWKGYGSEERCWVPKADIHALLLLKKFHLKYPLKSHLSWFQYCIQASSHSSCQWPHPVLRQSDTSSSSDPTAVFCLSPAGSGRNSPALAAWQSWVFKATASEDDKRPGGLFKEELPCHALPADWDCSWFCYLIDSYPDLGLLPG